MLTFRHNDAFVNKHTRLLNPIAVLQEATEEHPKGLLTIPTIERSNWVTLDDDIVIDKWYLNQRGMSALITSVVTPWLMEETPEENLTEAIANKIVQTSLVLATLDRFGFDETYGREFLAELKSIPNAVLDHAFQIDMRDRATTNQTAFFTSDSRPTVNTKCRVNGITMSVIGYRLQMHQLITGKDLDDLLRDTEVT